MHDDDVTVSGLGWGEVQEIWQEDSLATDRENRTRCGNTISPRDNSGTWGCCTLTEGHVPPCMDATSHEVGVPDASAVESQRTHDKETDR